MTLLNIDGAINTPVPVSWAVGPEDETGWQHVKAVTEDDAIATYAEGDIDVIEAGGLEVLRVEAWDDFTGDPVARDWLEAGLGYSCESCGEIATLDSGAEIVDDVTVRCGFCRKEQKHNEEES